MDNIAADMTGIFAEPAIAAIRDVAERKDVAAVVLRVDSPGGDALASELIWRAACLLGSTKPVVASMGSVAASGGYFIPMAAHRIFAQPSTITGPSDLT
jgi:protease-4